MGIFGFGKGKKAKKPKKPSAKAEQQIARAFGQSNKRNKGKGWDDNKKK